MAKCKRSAARALDWLVGEGAEVVAVVASEPDAFTRDEQRVDLVAQRHGLPMVTEEELHASPPADVDVVISFLFWKRIREPLLSLGRIGCLNFHPAPLPDIRGVGGYNVAVLEGMSEWGVSCHFVDPEFDTGDLVEVERFTIDPDTADRVLRSTWRARSACSGSSSGSCGAPLAGEELPRAPQGPGRYVSREEFESLRRVRPGDDLGRKLRAFWYPPYPGALIEVEGRELTLVDENLLADVAEAYRDSGPGALMARPMACASCGTENPAGARFCMACGATLERRCPNCGTPAPAGGALLHDLRLVARARDAPAPAAAPSGEPPMLPEERRQVTVLFADLSGYTAFAERHGPGGGEDARGPRADAPRPGGRALRRHRRQVHRRQRDGDLRRARRARGRRRARGSRRARHAGGDGRDERRACPTARTSRCAWASTRARCSRAPWATTTRSSATR